MVTDLAIAKHPPANKDQLYLTLNIRDFTELNTTYVYRDSTVKKMCRYKKRNKTDTLHLFICFIFALLYTVPSLHNFIIIDILMRKYYFNNTNNIKLI